MNKKFTALLMALLLALTLCSPALAGAEYGSFYDETEQISSDELTNLGEETFPQLSKTLGVDLRVDVFTDEGDLLRLNRTHLRRTARSGISPRMSMGIPITDWARKRKASR